MHHLITSKINKRFMAAWEVKRGFALMLRLRDAHLQWTPTLCNKIQVECTEKWTQVVWAIRKQTQFSIVNNYNRTERGFFTSTSMIECKIIRVEWACRRQRNFSSPPIRNDCGIRDDFYSCSAAFFTAKFLSDNFSRIASKFMCEEWAHMSPLLPFQSFESTCKILDYVYKNKTVEHKTCETHK